MKRVIIGFIVVIVILITVVYLLVGRDQSKQAKIIELEKSINSENINLNLNKNLNENEKKVIDSKNETESEVFNQEKISSGKFNKIDALHYAVGDVSVSREGENYRVAFKDNFASADGPDLYVYLSNQENIKNIALASVDTSKTVNLGTLKSINGMQSYLVSKEDFEAHNKSVIIWCKQFRVQFSRADLK